MTQVPEITAQGLDGNDPEAGFIEKVAQAEFGKAEIIVRDGVLLPALGCD